MTNREFLTAIVAMELGEISEFASNEIVKMDKTLAKRKEKTSAKALENAPLVDAAVACLGSEPLTASDIKDTLEVSVQKASYLLRTAVAQGRAVATDIKGKKGMVKGYTVA